ncbi:multidrug ABC transporter ATPase [Rummeliibacillus pycnus]|uniref:multidrug ABC transporter ATPase n=1 Tax=Rummeliibacillus pycnus TaxID=101070 RepID=UPI003D2E3BEB
MDKEKKQQENGSMATSFEEVQQLGEQMENRRNETELESVGRDQDPEQFDDK